MGTTTRLWIVLTVAVVTLAACQSAGVFDADEGTVPQVIQTSANDNTVPFHVLVENTAEIVPPFPPPILNAIFRGTARSHPFGFADFFGTTQVDITVFPNAQTTDFVFTYRDGDELRFTSAGISIPDVSGDTEFSGDYTIIGGTGRFANATGAGTYAGKFDASAGLGRFTMDGSISGFGGVEENEDGKISK